MSKLADCVMVIQTGENPHGARAVCDNWHDLHTALYRERLSCTGGDSHRKRTHHALQLRMMISLNKKCHQAAEHTHNDYARPWHQPPVQLHTAVLHTPEHYAAQILPCT